jgi:hypothetical protein
MDWHQGFRLKLTTIKELLMNSPTTPLAPFRTQFEEMSLEMFRRIQRPMRKNFVVPEIDKPELRMMKCQS